jgi:hypothetical protein
MTGGPAAAVSWNQRSTFVFRHHALTEETGVADLDSDTNKGKSKYGLRPEIVEAKERIYTEEKQLNGTNAEATEPPSTIEERMANKDNRGETGDIERAQKTREALDTANKEKMP